MLVAEPGRFVMFLELWHFHACDLSSLCCLIMFLHLLKVREAKQTLIDSFAVICPQFTRFLCLRPSPKEVQFPRMQFVTLDSFSTAVVSVVSVKYFLFLYILPDPEGCKTVIVACFSLAQAQHFKIVHYFTLYLVRPKEEQ